MQGNLELIPLLIPYWLTSEIKRWNLGLTCTPHLWIITWETKRWNLGLTLRLLYLNKTRNTKHVTSAGHKQDFLLYVTITHPSAIKVLQTTKITKLPLSLPVVFKRWFTISELKSKYTSCPPGKQIYIHQNQTLDLHPPNSNSQVLNIRPLALRHQHCHHYPNHLREVHIH